MTSNGLRYRLTEANIHEIVFEDVSTPTLAAFAECLKGIAEAASPGETLKILFSVPAIPSIQYMIAIARDIREKTPYRLLARIAIVYEPSLQLSLLNMVVRTAIRTSTIKLFAKKDELQAREWLAQ